MADTITRAERSALMGRIKGYDTKPEMFIRRALHSMGYRFRTHVGDLPGRPDVVFSRRQAVIFVHGCFWHRHGCNRTYFPRTRETFWAGKFADNVKRDRRNKKQLVEAGWHVLVVWECEVEGDRSLMNRVVAFLGPPRVAQRA